MEGKEKPETIKLINYNQLKLSKILVSGCIKCTKKK